MILHVKESCVCVCVWVIMGEWTAGTPFSFLLRRRFTSVQSGEFASSAVLVSSIYNPKIVVGADEPVVVSVEKLI